ncbi:MAG: hypothetical protein IKJ41_04950 [Clostridia bacterium]|nr:hypothetical protein [Clostridia bacterium]
MFLTALFITFKVVLGIVSIVGAFGLVIGTLIGIGALIAAIFRVFPVVGIVFAVILAIILIAAVSYAICRLIKFINH